MTDGIRVQQGESFPPYVGIAKVIIPYKKNREKYIKECYRTRQVSLLMQSGTIALKCNVSEEAIQNIKFPETHEQLGSSVIFVTEKVRQTPYIVAVLDKLADRVNLQENCFHISKTSKKNRIDVFGSGDGQMFVNIQANKDALLKIDVIGDNARVELNCSGQVKVRSSDSVKLESVGELSLENIDSSGLIDSKLSISPEGLKYTDKNNNSFTIDKENKIITLFNGGEPIPLGNTLKKELEATNKYLDDLKSAISSALIEIDALGVPASTSFTTAMLFAKKADFSNINSKKSFTD